MIKRPPRIHAFLPHKKIDFAEGCYHFSELIRNLETVSPYVQTNTLLTSETQMESGIGLDPLNNMEEVIQTLISHRSNYEDSDPRYKNIWSERWKDSWNIVKIEYDFSDMASPNYLDCESSRTAADSPNYTINHWLRIVEIIIKWRRPLYLWSGDEKYWYDGKGVFDPDRTIANWFCWVPQQVDPSLIPSAALVRPMLDGTLIVTSQQYFNIDDEAAIHRANDVEVEMNEAGILPSLDELRKG